MSEQPKQLVAPTGTHDVLPDSSRAWERLIGTFSDMAHQWGFGLVLTPMFEDVAVFNRGIGEESDVARKEMYVFEDRGGRTLALRPEGTASIVRAFVQHHPTTPWKAWYVTPAFRYERPQAGRYRQHHQLGVEVLGTSDPLVDVEVISLAWRFYEAIGLRRIRLLINSMGHEECRGEFVVSLRRHLTDHELQLCEEHQKVWSSNPLRVIDCKKQECRSVVDAGPSIADALCSECVTHFSAVSEGLTAIGVPWERNVKLVRGFDYYTRTTFEFVSDALDGAQNAVGGGGRYDRLAEDLGGSPTAGVGFGSGIERLLLALQAEDVAHFEVLRDDSIDVFVVDTTGGQEALQLSDLLRRNGFAVDRAFDSRSMKSQLKAADRSGARVAILVGPQELEVGTITMRDLRAIDESNRQRVISRIDVVDAVREAIETSLN
ncbi:MAG: histidine--tRNA ligase [Actinobacteria bacterium]|nr:histidine--tRNA ligase [Actinomycetota bacterium]